MTSAQFENLVRTGQLKREPPVADEVVSLARSGRARLRDAGNLELSPESRFDLAYNAAHALSLAALRARGYRAGSRYIVFQVLTLTTGVPLPTVRVLAKAHGLRNQLEYDGGEEIDERLLRDLIEAAITVERALDVRGR